MEFARATALVIDVERAAAWHVDTFFCPHRLAVSKNQIHRAEYLDATAAHGGIVTDHIPRLGASGSHCRGCLCDYLATGSRQCLKRLRHRVVGTVWHIRHFETVNHLRHHISITYLPAVAEQGLEVAARGVGVSALDDAK